MYAGKRCNSRSNMTKRYKLDRVAPVDNRPPPDNNFGPKQMWGGSVKTCPSALGPWASGLGAGFYWPTLALLAGLSQSTMMEDRVDPGAMRRRQVICSPPLPQLLLTLLDTWAGDTWLHCRVEVCSAVLQDSTVQCSAVLQDNTVQCSIAEQYNAVQYCRLLPPWSISSRMCPVREAAGGNRSKAWHMEGEDSDPT